MGRAQGPTDGQTDSPTNRFEFGPKKSQKGPLATRHSTQPSPSPITCHHLSPIIHQALPRRPPACGPWLGLAGGFKGTRVDGRCFLARPHAALKQNFKFRMLAHESTGRINIST